ncbi:MULTISPECIES: hypothetical protein [unclassified Paenibacillus]|uniref:hypothetical protein n=1 Tax=unclassified Paenibacillus TaxID=185978 RepID=UPI0024058668|nr:MULTISPECIES: hypothetical protein [unclassified Paenibacillus]MDF9843581.1 hypothetical protein [Paenibacillus sp. PastF-2]MDF9850170.1 hypothetical protein [Paenibacillus sp. PastM-2]MDF9857089.1 hypothetical protein [Paenibacillus sp. PastF-1]MDH6482360.1 hypothetical protein [Paenibacillus sp. PastH-2]MDH6509302.1 hypothetical protein [Paenibacillus sp. PastM-3]
MFHPTVFDNIKIAFENQLYDYDNLDSILMIKGRTDMLNLAVMSREFTLAFKLTDGFKVTSEVVLLSSVKELSDEILETPGSNPGCSLLLRFYMEVTDPPIQCPAVERILTGIWGPELKPEQSLSFRYGGEEQIYNNCIQLTFKRQITEEQMEDIPNLLAHLLQSAEELENV